MIRRCNRCKLPKDQDKEFSRHKDGDSYYINGDCKKCLSELQMIRYRLKKDDVDFKKKNRKRASDYATANKEKVQKREQERKATQEWKDYMKAWYAIPGNKERTAKLSKKRNKKWISDQRRKVTDQYVLSVLQTKTGLSREELRKQPELIAAKKRSIMIHRISKLLELLEEEQNVEECDARKD